jgi:Uma2 family endonuclease
MTATLEKPPTDSVILPHRFTIEEFQKLYESGVFPGMQHAQLIRGEIYFMSAMGAAHAEAITVLTELLVKTYSAYAKVSSQVPITIWNDSQPEPDFSLVKRDAPRGAANARDVLLAIEISDSTLKFDREQKIPEYARSSIPEVWILNLIERQLEIYRQPSGEKYLQLQIVEAQTPVAPLFAPEANLEWWTALEEQVQP